MSADDLFSRLNPVVVWILRSPLHVLLSAGLLLFTVTGRRSGRRYTIPVGYQRQGNRVTILVSEAARKQWWRNYLEAGPAELRIRGRDHEGRATVVDAGTEEFRESAAATLRRMPWLGRTFGIDYDRRAGLTSPQLEQLGREIAIVRVELGGD